MKQIVNVTLFLMVLNKNAFWFVMKDGRFFVNLQL